jgi:LysR family glycine cleavage system transcriptional activator
LVERELKEGTLVKAMEFSMPGYGFYVTYLPDHPYEAMIESFLASLRGLRCTD